MCDCGKARPGPYTPDQCRPCWVQGVRERAKRKPASAPAPQVKFDKSPRPPCVHEGRILSRCPVGDEARHVRRCDVVSAGVNRIGVCRTCPHYKPAVPELPKLAVASCPEMLGVQFPLRMDEKTLWPRAPGLRFNTSIVEWQGGYALATRTGWKGSDILVGRLNQRLEPFGEVFRLNLTRSECVYGREDPRLFVHKGKLHVAYVGVISTRSKWYTNVLFARIGPKMEVEDNFAPNYDRRRVWEKSWSMFDYEGELFAVYSTAPTHKVLRVECGSATLAHETSTSSRWSSGDIRGGASPARVGDEYWHFIHSSVYRDGLKFYNTGLVTFEARPPFRVKRMLADPILWADVSTKPADQYCPCVFVCGSARVGDTWLLSHGVHDRYTEVHAFSHAALERRLVPAG